jgi:hypothetical protein
MKKFQSKFTVPLLFMVLCVMYACKKSFLNTQPIGQLSSSTLANAAGVNGLLIGAYSLLDGVGGANGGSDAAASNWLMGSITAGDNYKGSQPSDGGADALPVGNFTEIASNPYTTDRYTELMSGVARANATILAVPAAKDLTTAQATQILAECRFLRGFYYLEARRTYGQVPYVDETVKNGNVSNTVEIYPKIEADFQFAFTNLPATQPNRGRANKYAAEAYLAKAYMCEQKFTDALPLFHDLISNGVTAGGQKYALTAVFQQNFSPESTQKNSAESVFACQSSVNDGGQGNNGNAADDLNFPYNSGPGACCGWFNPSQSLGNSFKTDANGLPMFTTFDGTGGDVSNPTLGPIWTGNVDPRIDITMGRPNVPYLDWGNPPASWIRDPTNGVFNPRKNVYSQSEKGINSDNTPGVWNNVELTSNNVNLMRFADILLMAAEAEVEAGSTDQALINVNLVRARAANPAGWVYKNSTYSAASSTYTVNATPADKYLVKPYPAGAFTNKTDARTAIRFERKLELACEGMRFFDLQRWDNVSQSLPNGSLQPNGTMAAEINAFLAYDIKINSQLQGAHFTDQKDEYFPLPQSEIDLTTSLNGGKPLMVQNHGW